MSRKVKKLNTLIKPVSFIQANTVKGFKYVDKAGELVNLYHTGNNPPRFSMNLDGLIINEPIQKVAELKITSTVVWMRFNEQVILDEMARIFEKETKRICEVLDTIEISRLGWRNYFVYELSDEKATKLFLDNIKILSNVDTEIIQFKLKVEPKVDGRLRIQLAAKADDINKKGVLFDLDLVKRDELEVKDIITTLRNFREFLQSEKGFLETVNNIIE